MKFDKTLIDSATTFFQEVRDFKLSRRNLLTLGAFTRRA